MRAGRVILLNGASSSGKSTLAEAVGEQLHGWFVMPADAFGAMRTALEPDAGDAEVAAVLRRTRMGYHRAVAGMVAAGNDVIMDYPLSEVWRVDDLLDVLGDADVLVVEVRCSAEELARRETARGDRPAGLAASQTSVYDRDHDLSVDTTDRSTSECAAVVVSALEHAGADRAWERMRAIRGAGGL